MLGVKTEAVIGRRLSVPLDSRKARNLLMSRKVFAIPRSCSTKLTSLARLSSRWSLNTFDVRTLLIASSALQKLNARSVKIRCADRIRTYGTDLPEDRPDSAAYSAQAADATGKVPQRLFREE